MNARENRQTKLNTTTRYSQNLIGLGFLLALTAGASAVDAHDMYHNLWSSEGERCCNDRDCGPANSRFAPSSLEMNVDDRMVTDSARPTHCAVLASSEKIDVPIFAFSNPTLGMQLTKVITATGSHVVEQEFPMRTDKDGKVHTCVRLDPEGDLDVICLINPQRK